MNERTNEIVPERRTSDFSPKTIRDFNRVKPDSIPLIEQRDTGAITNSPVPGAVRRILTPFHPLASSPSERASEPFLEKPSAEPRVKPLARQDDAAGNAGGPPFAVRMFAAISLVVFGTLVFGAYKLGESSGLHSAKPVGPGGAGASAGFPPENLPRLDAALQLLRDHDGVGAFRALQNLVAENPKAPSIRYAAAMAAMVADYRNDARRLLEGSISDQDRVSDSLAMKAAVEGNANAKTTATQETLLRAAIAADPMNPYPFLELANVLRSLGRSDEALAVLESAKLRLLPADSHVVVNTTLALLTLEKTELLGVSEIPVATGIAERDFPAAYALLKQENFSAAAALLSETEKQISPDLFSFLINDPAMRKYARQPALAGLYR